MKKKERDMIFQTNEGVGTLKNNIIRIFVPYNLT